MLTPKLKLGWATNEAAKFACENWHYAKVFPRAKSRKFGVWENGRYIGVILFGSGASANLSRSFGLTPTAVCELVRVALTCHETPVSRIVAIALKLLKKAEPKLKMCVSFADPAFGHHGGIYQAGNWVYTGETSTQYQYRYKNRWVHVRSIHGRIPAATLKALPKREVPGKLRYVMALDEEMKAKVKEMSKPYPKTVIK